MGGHFQVTFLLPVLYTRQGAYRTLNYLLSVESPVVSAPYLPLARLRWDKRSIGRKTNEKPELFVAEPETELERLLEREEKTRKQLVSSLARRF